MKNLKPLDINQKRESAPGLNVDGLEGKELQTNHQDGNLKATGPASKLSMPSPALPAHGISKAKGEGVGRSKAPFKNVRGQEDFDDVEDSEIECDGEEKANTRVNQIPNSQVNRNQQNKDPATTSAVAATGGHTAGIQGSVLGGRRLSRSILGGAGATGDGRRNADAESGDLLVDSQAPSAQNFENA